MFRRILPVRFFAPFLLPTLLFAGCRPVSKIDAAALTGALLLWVVFLAWCFTPEKDQSNQGDDDLPPPAAGGAGA
jgi:hypothetical protein